MVKKYGLIGFPLGHSKSAHFFNDKFEKSNIAAHYDMFETDNVQSFLENIKIEDNICGLNVTIPHKQKTMELMHYVDAAAETIGAINTIRISIRERKLYFEGFNTDWIGFGNSLLKQLVTWNGHKSLHKALILGTGGSAKAVAYVLDGLGISYVFVSRDAYGEILPYNKVDESVLNSCKLIINTTPVGMYPDVHQKPDINYNYVGKDHFLFDLIYNPARTDFLTEGKNRGAYIVNGMEMLELQAEASWKIWQE